MTIDDTDDKPTLFNILARLIAEHGFDAVEEAYEAAAAEALADDNCAHDWAYTGTAYGGDDSRWHGEGRCYCTKCGADGDA